MTTLQQSEREWIVSIRGKEIEKVVSRAEYKGDIFELIAYGFENYPEPQYFYIRLNGEILRRQDGQMLSSYWDDEVLYALNSHAVREMLFNNSKKEEFEW
jgi:hypothetical protein